MKNIFLESYIEYIEKLSKKLPNFWMLEGFESRRNQCKQFLSSINERFCFDQIICLETGASSNYDDGLFGLFLGIVVGKVGGEMHSVDISEDAVIKTKEIFTKEIPTLEYRPIVQDSIEYIKKIEYSPNLVHLDSFDFNILDPLPCALHGWREFEAIEEKVPSGGIIIIDDNYKYGTDLQWNFYNGIVENYFIQYPMLGKGAHVYQWVINNFTNWELIGNHYGDFENLKIIIQKK